MTTARPMDRRVRPRVPVVAMWLRIKKRHDNGGAPLIRITRIESNGWVYVDDWYDFDRAYPRETMSGGYTPPRERVFARDADEFSSRSLRYWKRVRTQNPNLPQVPSQQVQVDAFAATDINSRSPAC